MGTESQIYNLGSSHRTFSMKTWPGGCRGVFPGLNLSIWPWSFELSSGVWIIVFQDRLSYQVFCSICSVFNGSEDLGTAW